MKCVTMKLVLLFVVSLVLVASRADDDLVDLYVRHMDETMHGNAGAGDNDEDHRRDDEGSDGSPERLRRSVLESDYYKASDMPKQTLDEGPSVSHRGKFLILTSANLNKFLVLTRTDNFWVLIDFAWYQISLLEFIILKITVFE